MSKPRKDTMVAAVTKLITELLPTIIGWAKSGMKVEEIEARLRDPIGVGQSMIERACERQADGKAYLDRDPKPGA